MKAIVQHRYGAPQRGLRLEDVDPPTVSDHGLLVRVHAAGVNALDWHVITGKPYVARLAMGLRRPKDRIAGRDVAGTVEAVGPHVTRFAPGDEVFGWCDGTFAAYAHGHQDRFVAKPAGVGFVEAAALPVAAVTALKGLRAHGDIEPGHKVLVTGASGGVGSFAVQLAKAFGAEVTGVCSSRNVHLVGSLGADHVVDYTRQDFTRAGQRYDVILDIAGRPSLPGCRRSLRPGGTLVMLGGEGGDWFGPLPRMVRGALMGLGSSRRVRIVNANLTRDDGLVLADLLASGQLTPVIDRTYDLAAAPDAVAYLESGHTRGKVVIKVS